MIKKLFSSYVRYALLSSIMATVAFVLGSHIPHVSAIVASITVLVAIRPTFHASVKEGFYQIFAIIMGAGIALLLAVVIGKFSPVNLLVGKYSPITLFVALLLCFILSHFLSLGEGGAVSIGISIILVLGPKFDSALIETRFLGVALGSVLAMIASLWTRPGTPAKRALKDIIAQSEKISDLLNEMGDHLADPKEEITESITNIWLDEAKSIQLKVNLIRDVAEDVRKSYRWSPLIDKEEAEAVLSQVKITQATVTTVLNIVRDLRSVARHAEPLPEEITRHLSEAILATAEVVAEQSEVASENPAQKLDSDTAAVKIREQAQESAINHLREIEEDYPLLIGGSVLQDTHKINSMLTES